MGRGSLAKRPEAQAAVGSVNTPPRTDVALRTGRQGFDGKLGAGQLLAQRYGVLDRSIAVGVLISPDRSLALLHDCEHGRGRFTALK